MITHIDIDMAGSTKEKYITNRGTNNKVLFGLFEGKAGEDSGQWVNITMTPAQAIAMGQALVKCGIEAEAKAYDLQQAKAAVKEPQTPAILKTVGVDLDEDA